MVLLAEFATPGGLERFGRDLSDFPFPDLDDSIERASLELVVRYRRTATYRGAVVDRVTIGVNGMAEPLARIENGESLRAGEPLYVEINFAHPVIATLRTTHPDLWSALEAGDPWEGADEHISERRAQFETTVEQLSAIAVSQDLLQRALGTHAKQADRAAVRWRPFFAIARSSVGALPAQSEAIRLLSSGDIEGDEVELATLRRQLAPDVKRIEELERSITARELAAKHVRTLLEMVVLGTTSQLASFLGDARYIGPLRTIPPRGFLYERTGRITSWADGLAAWDMLLADRLTLVERTNGWLQRLGAGCQIEVQQLFHRGADAEELSESHADKTVRRLLLDTASGSFVLPSEVGAGISQIIPVVVAAVEGRGSLTLVEQPELHVHPALQVGLGDLFIDAITRSHERQAMLIETHSEHIMLRLLRRIEEKSRGDSSDESATSQLTPELVSVMFVEQVDGEVRTTRLRIDETGEFVDQWPHGFFEERAGELF
jgi:hypothetical protein